MTERILVTGSDGFIGKHLVIRLKELLLDVVTLDLKDGDIATLPLNYNNIDHVFHLASKTFVPASWENPYEFYKVNVLGTENVLELCRRNNCSLTYISSYVYGTPKYLPVDETHPVDPVSPYNHSKLIAEQICQFYALKFNIQTTIFRPVNIFGPGQNDNFLIPEIIAQVLDNRIENVEVMDLRPKRDYLYITDFIRALILSIERKKLEIFNIGSGVSISVEDIIRIIMTETGIKKPYSSKKIERKNEVWDVYANIQKISQTLHWIPETSFLEGIRNIVKSV